MDVLVLWVLRIVLLSFFGYCGYLASSAPRRVPDWYLVTAAVVVIAGAAAMAFTGEYSLALIITPWVVGAGIGYLRRQPRVS